MISKNALNSNKWSNADEQYAYLKAVRNIQFRRRDPH